MLDFFSLSLEYIAETIRFKANVGTNMLTKNPFAWAIEGLSMLFSMRSEFTYPSEKIHSKTLKMPPYTAKKRGKVRRGIKKTQHRHSNLTYV